MWLNILHRLPRSGREPLQGVAMIFKEGKIPKVLSNRIFNHDRSRNFRDGDAARLFTPERQSIKPRSTIGLDFLEPRSTDYQ